MMILDMIDTNCIEIGKALNITSIDDMETYIIFSMPLPKYSYLLSETKTYKNSFYTNVSCCVQGYSFNHMNILKNRIIQQLYVYIVVNGVASNNNYMAGKILVSFTPYEKLTDNIIYVTHHLNSEHKTITIHKSQLLPITKENVDRVLEVLAKRWLCYDFDYVKKDLFFYKPHDNIVQIDLKNIIYSKINGKIIPFDLYGLGRYVYIHNKYKILINRVSSLLKDNEDFSLESVKNKNLFEFYKKFLSLADFQDDEIKYMRGEIDSIDLGFVIV